MTIADTVAALGARALRTRWLVRAPIRLYRAGLGFLFGSRLLMLEHLGRRTGARRYAVLEVVDRPAPGDYIIVSGFGGQAQWYRNIHAEPRVRVWTGHHRATPATATPLTGPQAAAALDNYIRAHPRAWKNLRAAIEHATGAPVETLPMVRLRLNTPGCTRP
ncbi:nitroreductase family deazaflavin-dependent oxidoreductase [Nocardia terpenica]|uniref:nitroreductase family deazaflavin-dependent oxidoreductase n=1 Tax=Nocardia terpenica TaxID=455432 RepID=UPI001893952A|nr:nitroreductase family deazaflavin-dependent oxidoreductase [Nocardia terpenica]MBF6064665.1 nitroreductase family deazaflavin-dependent oxidoreductase [Nocardia terpenica]MBF6107181.1 nitroreductase family deazaflavin-dependent oxidoreductase [Nocardia terpenica]MBF6114939.1 nitroreductase family deazaflavin-dependent oxidoreductase [Nocardia terpenica]MBF6122044.1 nitroreductase family deazaflavin-dependent oxidoreductase [Nocardia terpenica]MBF6154427.1 nitroreductase family deazaflavin-d